MSKLILCGGGKPILEIIKKVRMPLAGVYTHEGNDELIQYCQDNRILWTTDSINDRVPPVKGVYVASLYYKHIIGHQVIEMAEGRIFNAHAALLPKHRGRCSVPWSIFENDTFSGVTYHYIDEGIDTGPIILQAATPLNPYETQNTLFERIDRLVIELFPAALQLVMVGFPGVAQEGESDYHKGLPNDGEINPNWPIHKIKRFIRAMEYDGYKPASFQGQYIRSFDEYTQVLSDNAKRKHSQPLPAGIRIS